MHELQAGSNQVNRELAVRVNALRQRVDQPELRRFLAVLRSFLEEICYHWQMILNQLQLVVLA